MNRHSIEQHAFSRTKRLMTALLLCAVGLAACGDSPYAPGRNDNPDAGFTDGGDTGWEDTRRPTCGIEGATQYCTCTDGSSGAQQCLANGAWSGCACEAEPIDCVVGEWSEWGTCSAECDGGTQTRSRDVLLEAANGGAPCGDLTETQACKEQACPSCTDGIENNGEEGVDCGGTCDMLCPGIRIDNFDLAGQGPAAELIPGATFDVELDYAIRVPDCSNCATQLLVTVEAWVVDVVDFTSGWQVVDAACVYDGIPGAGAPVEGSAVVTLLGTGFDSPTVRYVQTRETNCDVALDRVFNGTDGQSQGYELGPLTVIDVPQDFEIQHVDSGLCLDVPYSSMDAGVDFITYACTGNDNQRFNLNYLFTSEGVARYRVQVTHSGLCFDVTGGIAAVENYRTVQQYDCVGGENQYFELHARRGGYALHPVHSDKCLEVPDNSHDWGAVLEQYDCRDQPAQVFAFVDGL